MIFLIKLHAKTRMIGYILSPVQLYYWMKRYGSLFMKEKWIWQYAIYVEVYGQGLSLRLVA